MIQVMKILLLVVFTYFVSLPCLSQERKLYGKDFDYKLLVPKDTFNYSEGLPSYYVCCTYSNNVLIHIDIFQKEDWMNQHLHVGAEIVSKEGRIYFLYGEGKTRSGGYGRLFPKKIKMSDTAMLKNDTLIFKRTTPYSVQLHYAVNIFSDSVTIYDKNFPLNKKGTAKSSLSSFVNYTQWNNLNNYSRFYLISLSLKKNEIVKAKKMIYDGTKDYSFGYLHNQEFFTKKGISASLFWIKHTGSIY